MMVNGDHPRTGPGGWRACCFFVLFAQIGEMSIKELVKKPQDISIVIVESF